MLDLLRSVGATAAAFRAATFPDLTVDKLREILNQPDRRGRKPRPDDPEERERLLRALRKHGSTRVAAAACEMSQTTFLRRIKEPDELRSVGSTLPAIAQNTIAESARTRMQKVRRR